MNTILGKNAEIAAKIGFISGVRRSIEDIKINFNRSGKDSELPHLH